MAICVKPAFKRRVAGVAWLGVLAQIAGQGAAWAADEDLFFSEMPVVASLSRLPQRLADVPGSVTVIDQEMIRASGFRSVEDLLRLVPGFQVTSHNQDPAIAVYHGLNTGLNSDEYGPRLQVLIDGRSQYSPLFKGGVNWNLLPVALENIERIEVIRGANTVSYGSNAFMGVVNIVTFDSSQTRGWLLSANHGNNGIREQTVRWGGKAGDADVRLTYRKLGDNGYQKGLYSDDVWVGSPDDRRSDAFDLRADLPLSNRDELQLTVSQVRDQSQFGRPDRPTRDPIRELGQRSTALGLQWRRIIADGEELRLRYGYTEDVASGPYRKDYSFTQLSGASTLINVAMQPGGRSVTNELELEHLLTLSRRARMSWGVSAKSVALESMEQFSTTDTKSRQSLRSFANLEYRPVEQWVFNAGASVENDSLNGLLFDPRLSASYHFQPGQTARLVVSRAHRTPSLYEMMGRVEMKAPGTTAPMDLIYYSGGVKPEQMDTVELGYLGEFRQLRASADVRAFIERIPNRIQLAPLALPASSPDDADSPVSRYFATQTNGGANTDFPFGRADGSANLERVMIRGYEYQLRWQPFDGTRLLYNGALITLQANYTNVGLIADGIGLNTDKIVQQTRESAPVRAQSAMLIQQLPYGMQGSVMYFRAGPMRWRRNGDTIQPSERIDWRLAKAFRMGQTRAEVAYTVQMANESQEGRQSNRIADTLHWLSLSLNF